MCTPGPPAARLTIVLFAGGRRAVPYCVVAAQQGHRCAGGLLLRLRVACPCVDTPARSPGPPICRHTGVPGTVRRRLARQPVGFVRRCAARCCCVRLRLQTGEPQSSCPQGRTGRHRKWAARRPSTPQRARALPSRVWLCVTCSMRARRSPQYAASPALGGQSPGYSPASPGARAHAPRPPRRRARCVRVPARRVRACAAYSPTSPAYSPTSPGTSRRVALMCRERVRDARCPACAAYSPTSPAYSPTSPGTRLRLLRRGACASRLDCV